MKAVVKATVRGIVAAMAMSGWPLLADHALYGAVVAASPFPYRD